MPRKTYNFSLVLSLFLFNYYAFAGTFITYVSLFFAARGLSVPQIGVLLALIQVMRIIGPNLWGWLADRSGRRVLVLRLTALSALLAFSGMFAANSFLEFAIIMALLNLFTSAQGPLAEALVLSELHGDIAGYGRIRLWGSIGFIAAVIAAGIGLDAFGVDALPWIVTGLLLLVFGASLRIRETPASGAAPGEDQGRGKGKGNAWQLLRKPEVAAFFVSVALMCAAHMALSAFYSLYLQRAGYSKPVIGLMWSLGVVAEVAFFYYQSHLFARFGARRLMMFAFAAAVLRFVVIGAGAGWLAVLVVAQLMHAATFAAHHSACVMAMQRWYSGPLQAGGQALYMSVGYGIGGTVGGLFMSFCWDRISPEAMFHMAALVALAGGVVAGWSFRRQDASEHGAPGQTSAR